VAPTPPSGADFNAFKQRGYSADCSPGGALVDCKDALGRLLRLFRKGRPHKSIRTMSDLASAIPPVSPYGTAKTGTDDPGH
jgi:hypothetical protein